MRKVLWLWTVTFVIILLWLYFLFISPKIFNNKILVVPEIINLSEEEGIKVLKDNNIKYNIVYLENEENIILNFSPASGTPLEAEINLIDTREIKTIILNGDIVYGE